MPKVGEVWRHARFYQNEETGELCPKFLLILAIYPDNDLVCRLLTSRHARPKVPACFHGDPYPGYFLGIPTPTGLLNKDTWLDLRGLQDFDAKEFCNSIHTATLSLVYQLSPAAIRPLLGCAGNAPDTTKRQSKAIYDALSLLG